MNILFFSAKFYPSIGGVEKHVLEVSKELVKKGHRITVVSELPPKIKYTHKFKYQSSGSSAKSPIKIKQLDKSIYSYTLMRGSVTVYLVDYSKNPMSKKIDIWLKLWKIKKVILESEIIHCHDVYFWYLPFRFLFPWKKSYVTFHGYEGYPLKRNWILLHKISKELSRGNISIGNFIEKWYGTRPTLISHGAAGIPPARYKVEKPNQSALFFGRLDEQTGIKEYIKAYKIIKQIYPKFKLTVVGDGHLKKIIPKEVTIVPFTSNLEPYFRTHYFIYTSRYLSIIESLLRKKTIIAGYDNPIKEDYLKLSPMAHFIFLCSTPEEIAMQTVQILKDPMKARKRVLRGYSWSLHQTWEKMAGRYLKLWGIE